MIIRKYKESDFEDVDYLQRDFYLHPATQEELRCKLRGPSWVADEDGVIGSAITCPESDNTLLWSLIVASSYRGLKVGTRLLSAVEDYYQGTKLALYVETDNHRARQFYFRRGYRASQYLKDFYGQGYGAIEMFKKCV